MKRIIIVVDTLGWAFHNIALQIQRAFGDRYDIIITDRVDVLGVVECDTVLYFWWPSALRGQPWIKAKRTAIGMYDHWSRARMPGNFANAIRLADVWFCANDTILGELSPSVLTTDGVDLTQFAWQPFPKTFTVGWTGNNFYENAGHGDLKGVRLIREACERLRVPLLIQDKQAAYIDHADMAEKFYRKISCYVCASVCEGTPNPVLEALACGRPVVSTRVGIVPNVVQHGRNGFIVERTVDAIADGIGHASMMPYKRIRATAKSWDWKRKALAFAPVLEGTA